MTLAETFREHPRRVLLLFGYALTVVVASVLPTPAGGLTPTGPLGVVGVDKWMHAVGYAVLGFGVASALGTRRAREIGWAVAAASLFGATLELVQALLPYRSCSLFDMGANVFGAVLGGGLWYAATRLQNGR